MRNPDRIHVFCEELARLWESNCPDWRFGQFIMNVLPKEIFFYEESDILEMMRNYFEEPIDGNRCVECEQGFECCREDMPCAYRDAYGKCTDDCPDFNWCSNCTQRGECG